MKNHQINQKTDNLKEHLITLVKDVDDKSKELTKISGRVEVGIIELKELNKEIKDTRRLLKGKLDELYETEFLISQAEAHHLARKQEITDSEAGLISELSSKKLNLSNDIKVLEDRLNLATVNFERSSGIYEDSLTQLERRIETLSKEEEDARSTYNSILVGILEQDKLFKYKENQMRVLEQKIVEAGIELETVIERSSDVLKNLDDRERIVHVKELDARIVTERLKKLHKGIYPQAELKI